MRERKEITTRGAPGRLVYAAALLLAACGSANLDRRYDRMLAETGRARPLSAIAADDGRALFAGATTLERAAVVEAVLARNPDVEAARQAWRAALAGFPQAAALDDPMLSYSFAPLSIASDARFGQRVELGQMLPFPGKKRLAGEVALAEAEAARGSFEAVRLELALMASNLYDDLYVAARAIDVNRQHQELLAKLKKSAEAQYAAGRAPHQDPLQAEVELVHLERDRVVLETDRDVVIAQLNGLLHRRPEAPLPVPPAELPAPTPPPASAAELQDQALAARPELRAQTARIRGALAGIDAARREYEPDFQLMASYDWMWDTPEHRWMVGVGINVPLELGRRRAAVEQAESRSLATRSENEKLRDQIRVDVASAALRAREGARLVEIVEKRLLPAARDQVDASIAGFVAGQNAFLAVIEAEKNLREVELMRHSARADLDRRLAALDRALGRVPGMSSPARTIDGEANLGEDR
ncbi:MAG TPA: TolC family protein [Candidatus Acidoferrum sp.]|nr:TolC family protein [Candidatus Acidoferrum sp.]